MQSARLRVDVGHDESALETFELTPGESIHLRPGVRHRVTALVDTVLLDASLPISTMSSASRTGTAAKAPAAHSTDPGECCQPAGSPPHTT